MIERTDPGTNGVMRNGHDLIDHNLRGLLQAIFRRGLNGKAKQRRIKKLGCQEADRHAPKRREEIGLQDKGRPGFPALVALGSDRNQIAAFHPLSQSAIAEMKSRTGLSCADRAARRACLRHSVANPAARVSGTQICTGRKPFSRNRLRYRLCFSFEIKRASDGIRRSLSPAF